MHIIICIFICTYNINYTLMIIFIIYIFLIFSFIECLVYVMTIVVLFIFLKNVTGF